MGDSDGIVCRADHPTPGNSPTLTPAGGVFRFAGRFAKRRLCRRQDENPQNTAIKPLIHNW
jgi:hypothetical protein